MANLEKEMVFEQLKDSSTKRISIIDQIEEMHDDITKIRRKSNLTKAAKDFTSEEESKLLFLQDMIKMAVIRAYNDPELLDKMSSYGQLIKHFDIEVIVRQK